jgi:glycerate kinase
MMVPMKIVIAPDSFKESISAARVAEAIAEGVLAACPTAQLDLCPMADGGEGTVDALVAATGGEVLSVDTFDPLGQEIRARIGLLGQKQTAAMLPGAVGLSGAAMAVDGEGRGGHIAVVEMASAIGLALVRPDRRNPLRTTSYGSGRLILAALDAGATEIIIGLGGSSTVDGGCGMAQALGVDFRDADGEECVCGLSGDGLAQIAEIDTRSIDPRLAQVRIRVACDVTNPLLGPQGAAAIFGPQKGASEEDVIILESRLTHLAALLQEQLGCEVESLSGGGAAGGLGAGLVAFCGATLEPGGPLIADTIDLPRRLATADLCITGEGRLDGQSAFGKVPMRVADIAGRGGVPTICIAGDIADDAPLEHFAATASLVGDGITTADAMAGASTLLAERAKACVEKWLAQQA